MDEMEPSRFESSADARLVWRRWRLAATGLGALLVAALAEIFYHQPAYVPSQQVAADVQAEAAAAAAAKKAADAQTAACHRDYNHKNYAAAAQSCREAATLGVIVAQAYLGEMCHLGLGVPRNDAEALKWDRKAAALGNAEAQFNLGVMFYKGYGVGQDYSEAMSWFRMAATQGNVDAQKLLIEAEQQVSEPAGPANQAPAGYFTIGSSKAQVLALQGTPTGMQTQFRGGEQWSYNNCSVTFDDSGLVRAYSNYCGKLRVAMTPVKHFTIGSTKAQVLAIQGTPTSVQSGFPRGSERWFYDGCSVAFDESGRVNQYSNMCGQLHVEMDSPGNGVHVKVYRYRNDQDDDNGDDEDQ
ncbi:hypothetical protein [Candidatus Binatus sp.]|jgi:hypothetical protein|uniref:hypothetical protein n=1 Tax=Candidatus Binatus sp. TaxID=2811406 RepID=UPI003F9DA0E4